jgi:hypothetical protein
VFLVHRLRTHARLPGDIEEREGDAVLRIDGYGYEIVCKLFPQLEHVPVQVPCLVVDGDAQETPYLGGRKDESLAFMADDFPYYSHGVHAFLVIKSADFLCHMSHLLIPRKLQEITAISKQYKEYSNVCANKKTC